jgi:tellurite resistance protein
MPLRRGSVAARFVYAPIVTPNDKSVLKCLIAVAWADGQVEEPEVGLIDGLLWAYGASDDEEAELREYAKTKRSLKECALPDDLKPEDRELALANAALLTHADGEQSAPEKRALAELAKKLGYTMDAAKPIIASARSRAQKLASRVG